jgi:hypothetical protein
VAKVGHCSRIVVMNVLFYFSLAAILEKTYFRFRSLQPIEYRRRSNEQAKLENKTKAITTL